MVGINVVVQLVVGTGMGILLGRLAVRIINKLKWITIRFINNASCFWCVIFAATYF